MRHTPYQYGVYSLDTILIAEAIWGNNEKIGELARHFLTITNLIIKANKKENNQNETKFN